MRAGSTNDVVRPLTIAEATFSLGVSVGSVRTFVQSGGLKHYRRNERHGRAAFAANHKRLSLVTACTDAMSRKSLTALAIPMATVLRRTRETPSGALVKALVDRLVNAGKRRRRG